MTTNCTCNDKDTSHKSTTITTPPDTDGFSRRIIIAGAHYCEQMKMGVPGSLQPGNSHGIGSVRMLFGLIGPKGAVQWALDTNWYLAASRKHMTALSSSKVPSADMSTTYIGYCALTPQSADREAHTACEWLDGRPCYGDGSFVRAERFLEDFLRSPETIWTVLRREYDTQFARKTTVVRS